MSPGLVASLAAVSGGNRDVLSAGGTVSSPKLALWRRIELWIELVVLFGGAPLAMHWAVHGEHIPLFVALLPVFVIGALLLLIDPTFRLRRELSRGVPWRTLLSIAAVLVVVGGAATLWITHTHPDWFLEFPKTRPDTYNKIMVLYPVFSVASQELVYRTLYFHRYGPLFGEQRWAGVVLNGALFGFAHIVIDSPFAIAATVAGGLLLALRYAATRSYWAVFLEHTLWGWLIFTVGFGRFFFSGVSNL